MLAVGRCVDGDHPFVGVTRRNTCPLVLRDPQTTVCYDYARADVEAAAFAVLGTRAGVNNHGV